MILAAVNSDGLCRGDISVEIDCRHPGAADSFKQLSNPFQTRGLRFHSLKEGVTPGAGSPRFFSERSHPIRAPVVEFGRRIRATARPAEAGAAARSLGPDGPGPGKPHASPSAFSSSSMHSPMIFSAKSISSFSMVSGGANSSARPMVLVMTPFSLARARRFIRLAVG